MTPTRYPSGWRWERHHEASTLHAPEGTPFGFVGHQADGSILCAVPLLGFERKAGTEGEALAAVEERIVLAGLAQPSDFTPGKVGGAVG